MRSKVAALVLLAVVSFFGPFLEMLIAGRVEPYGNWEIGETLIALVLVFWWYHVDKAQQGYRAGPLMNGGMLLVMVIAMPIYLIRSRGWKRGLVASLVAAACFGASLGLGEAGEALASFFIETKKGPALGGRGRARGRNLAVCERRARGCPSRKTAARR